MPSPLENTQIQASPSPPSLSFPLSLSKPSGLFSFFFFFLSLPIDICTMAASAVSEVTSNLPRLSQRAEASLLALTKHFQSTLGFLHG